MRNSWNRIISILTAGIVFFSSFASSLTIFGDGTLISAAQDTPETENTTDDKVTRTTETSDTADGNGMETTDNADSEEQIEKDLFLIKDENDFMAFTENCRLDEWSLNRKVRLDADLNLSGSSYRDFDGISSFSGYFDGNGHTISGVYLSGGTEAVGLFHYLEQEGTITDLNVNINLSSDNSADILGGIVGINSGTIRNCTFTGNVSGSGTTGGIAGYNGNSGAIEECKSAGTIKSSHTVGGIAGENRGVISDSVNSAEINSDSSWFEEDDSSSNAMSLSGLIDTGTELILNGTDIGGIAGYSDGIIAGCNNAATVGYLHTGRNIGGIVGRQNGDVINCKNTGSIFGKQDVGGIVGLMEPALTFEDAEKLNEEVDALHDDIDTLINDLDAMGDTVHSDLSDLNAHADTASDTASAITTELRDVIETDVDVVNDLSSRMTYVVNHMPEVMDYLDAALYSMETLGKDFTKLQDDMDIESKMEEETHDPAADQRLVLQSGVGGSLSSDNANPAEGAEVKIKLHPETGYALSTLLYIPYKGESSEVTSQVKESSFSFTMPAENVTIQAVYAYVGNYVARSNVGGRIELEQSTDMVRIRAIPYSGYMLEKVTVEEINITDSFKDKDGILTAEINKSITGKTVFVEGTFVKEESAHPITVASTTGGVISTDSLSAAAGKMITVTSSASQNYKLNVLKAASEDGSVVEVTQSGENTYTFTMPDQKVLLTAEYIYIPDTNTKVYTESTVGGVVGSVPNITNNEYYITMSASAGYEISKSDIVLEIYENGNDIPTKQLTSSELEEITGGYRYTMNLTNYTAPIKVMGYFSELSVTTYTVTTVSSTGGAVTADRSIVSGGDELRLAVVNDQNYILSSLQINGEDISKNVENGTVSYIVPEDISKDLEVTATYVPAILIITSTSVGGSADYKNNGEQITVTVVMDSGYSLKEPLNLRESDDTDILYQKQYADSYIYSFTVTDSMKQGQEAYLELEFESMNDKETVEKAKNAIAGDSAKFSESMSLVSSTTDQIRDLMTDDFGEIRSVEDLSQEELEQLQGFLVDLADALGCAGAYASSIIQSLSTISTITAPYLEEAWDALNTDLDQINADYQTMVSSLQGASNEARAIVDYLNSLEELQFRNLSEDFDSNSDKLSEELDTILDIMQRLNNHVDLYSGKIEDDMRVVNDRLNTIFDMILTRMDNIENLTNGNDILDDHSADEVSEYDSSNITSCMNTGRVNGDINIGGITGCISREADERSESAVPSNKVGTKYIVRAIVSDCNNEGFVKVKTENGGGVAGNVAVGLISHSLSSGIVVSDEGKCLGGIAGYSTGTIRDCGSKTELSGGEYIGGIAGKARSISNSVSMAYIMNSVVRVGAIAAAYLPDEDASDDMTVYRRSLKKDYVDNCYVSSQLYGIDGVSYAGVAEPVTYSELLQKDGIDRSFKTMEILFLDEEDNLVDRIKTNYGTRIEQIEFPQIQTDDDDYYEWEGPDVNVVESNLVYHAVVTANVTVLQSVQKSNGKPLAFAEGIYTESTVMNVEEVSMMLPGSVSNDAVTHMERVTITDSSLSDSDEIKLRLLNIDGLDNSVVYVYRDNGWKKMEQTDAGNYIQVTMRGTDETFCIASEPHRTNYVMIGAIAGCAGFGVVLLILLLLFRHKKKKIES
ncbi:MAG: hypothetical protein IJ079_01705 [Lachnospiraceae bacterium]|nr:hypothetical protein [Lachnospiraceae bacterium]